ncbi:MAG: hypothetical protein ACYSU8_04030 [Planctomycetota bacterium]|jgi:hypothetical protein
MINLIKNNNSRFIRLLWCLLAVWILWQFGSALARSAFLPRRVQKSLRHYKESTQKSEQTQSSKADPAQEPKSMFAPPPKLEMPKCTAVLGDEALINGKWYKAGSTTEGAEIVSINPESIKILWEGKEHTLVPFDVQVQDANQSPDSKPAPAERQPSGSPQLGDNPRRPRGMMSDDERQQMRERFRNASPEEREAMRQEMRERFGRRGRGREDR